jgi:hypothetical protein
MKSNASVVTGHNSRWRVLAAPHRDLNEMRNTHMNTSDNGWSMSCCWISTCRV